ncbi:conserved hypothetical protein [Tenacibaculum maritimum]|uniref:DUF2326 domain-containing protein n=1 Tax=Tenacibaculum maritimum TaxID=107401 RepID=UPI0012E6C183|nr:DUF2326 domain-containing protein [Tenacibaculum maritimum]CAA0213641.1 conserved hypothetical protein [Tenacibaculum maritimum]
MFLKSLTISKEALIIREIEFRKGINLIIDESQGQITGNSVGKTTVLKLIDFCLGADKKNIWIEPENPKEVYQLVKDYLIEKKILITLVLSKDLDDEDSDEIVIQRNFLSSKSKIIRKINGVQLIEDEFEPELSKLIFPEHTSSKPTFRQIISHNIRYKDLNISNTLKTLNRYTSDAEYETLYLFLLGCEFEEGNEKQNILQSIKQEENFKKRLEKTQTKSAYETALELVDMEIQDLDEKKSSLNLNENFERDLNNLNSVKLNINRLSSQLSKLKIRRDLIIEANEGLEKSVSKIDVQQLHQIYNQFTDKVGSIQKTFDELVTYHNQMITKKQEFILKELPIVENKIKNTENDLNKFLKDEISLSKTISKSDSFEDLEKVIIELNDRYKAKGEYEKIIEQLNEVDENLKDYNEQLEEIEGKLFSNEFEGKLKIQLKKFNKHFSATSEKLYGEKYALKYDIKKNKKGQRVYKFSAFNLNFSSGKKQGEISCFDIAYTFFADEENIPCLHFLLNDKKELMHNNQLIKIAELVNENEIQFVASILKDKLPNELDNEDYFIIKLSNDDKLFRIEN